MSCQSPAAQQLFAGSGEMVERCRALDWATTPLGPVEGWSQSLRTMAAAVLASRNPMLLFWGPRLVQFYNDAFRPSLGPSTGTASRHPRALGMPAAEFWTDVWDTIGSQIAGVMERGEAVWFEDLYLPIERGEGVLDEAWWTYSYSPVRDDDGCINGTLVVCLETTETVKARKATEFERRRLTDLFRLAPAFMCVLRGPDLVFELANDNYMKLVGFREVLGKPVREALPEIESQGYFDLLDQVLATGGPFVGEAMPVEIQRSSGGPLESRYVNFVFQAIREADGSISGVFVHGVDVTESIRAREAAELASRAKSDFLAVMSHELRTPLHAIAGYADLLETGVHGPLTDAQRTDVERIRSSGRMLLDQINQVLSYAQAEAGVETFDIEDLEVEEVVAACESLVMLQCREKRLALRLDGSVSGVRARANREKVRQILINLLTNSVKCTDPGGEIVIACESRDGQVALSVTDTGCGMEPDQLERIFDPFVQVGSRGTTSGGGVGLGLAISRKLARGMGGELAVHSAPGVGSTFTLTLPRAGGG